MLVNNKAVDVHTIEIEGAIMGDFPDFSDAFVSYACFIDGKELSNSELDYLQDTYPHEIHKLLIERLY